jgi:hypothetical protein
MDILIICLCIALEIGLCVLFVRSRRSALLWAMGLVLLLSIGGVLVHRFVVAWLERPERAINAAAAELEANNEKGVLAYVAPQAKELRDLIHSGMQRVVFSRVAITRLVVFTNDAADPPTAKAHVQGNASFQVRLGEIPVGGYQVKDLSLDLRREGNRWLISGFDWKDRPY